MEAGRAINLESPVFVVGRPRSGTTLMSAMLDAHRDIAISPGESRIFNHWQVHYSHLDLNKPRDFDIFWSKFTEPDSGFPIFAVEEESLRRRILESSPRNIKTVLDALMSEYAAQFGKCVCGEKTPMHYRHLPLLTEWYPKARIIFTLRDPRAVSASLMKVEWSGKNIYHQTLEWLYFIRTVEQWSGDPRAFSFRYEDLVKDPEDICRKLCAHLQLEYDPNMVKREGMAHRNQNAWRPDMSVHHNQAIQPISMHSLDKWRGDLTRRQIRIIEEYAGEEMRRYGYSPETAGLRGIEKIGLSAEESVRTVLGYVRSRRQEEALISESPIFIMGRPRSGTTLMASMLDAHPEIAILMAETGMFRRWYWRARALNLDSPEDFNRYWRDLAENPMIEEMGLSAQSVRDRLAPPLSPAGILRALGELDAELSGKLRWGEKSPMHYMCLDRIFDAFPGARALILLRDPRAILASLQHVPWKHRPSPEFEAYRWMELISVIRQRAADRKVKVVRYEDLTLNTEILLRDVCDWLEEEYSPAMLNRSGRESRINAQDEWRRQHMLKTLAPISTDRINKWRDELSGHQIGVVEHICGVAMREFGYELSGARIPLHERMSLGTKARLRRWRDRLDEIKGRGDRE